MRQLDEEGALLARMGAAHPHAAERAAWERRAVAAYTEAAAAGTVPRIETLSTCLAVLRSGAHRPLPVAEGGARGGRGGAPPPRATAALSVSRAPASPPGSPGRPFYPERALVLYEEAQAAGVVPRFALHAPSVLDLRPLPPAAAEVAVLTALRVLRRRRAASGDTAPVHALRLRVHDVDELARLTAGAQHGVALRRARTGVRAAELLRALGIPFEGGVEDGALTLAPDALLAHLRPVAVASSRLLPGLANLGRSLRIADW